MRQSANKIIIYTDGGARNNPGPAAIAAVITTANSKISAKGGSASGGQILNSKEYSEYIGEGTNNEAEYKAVLFALKKVKQLIGGKNAENAKIEIRLDSELIGKQMQGKYKILEPELQTLFIQVWNLQQDFGEVVFKIIPRSENKMADRLVNEALEAVLQKGRQKNLF